MSLGGIPYIGPYSAALSGLYVATGFNKRGMTNAMAAAMILTDLVPGRGSLCRCILTLPLDAAPQPAISGFETAVGPLTPTPKRCPHSGCALKWSKQERTWSCPCHGSRFTKEGRLLGGSAAGDPG